MESSSSYGTFISGKRRKYADPALSPVVDSSWTSLFESTPGPTSVSYVDLTGQGSPLAKSKVASGSTPINLFSNGGLKSYMYRPEVMQGTPMKKPIAPLGGWKASTTTPEKKSVRQRSSTIAPVANMGPSNDFHTPKTCAPSPSIFVESDPTPSIEHDTAAKSRDNQLPQSTGALLSDSKSDEMESKTLFEADGIPSASLAADHQNTILTEAEKAEKTRLRNNELSRIWNQKQKAKDREGYLKRKREANRRCAAKKKAKLEAEKQALPTNASLPLLLTPRASEAPETADNPPIQHYENTEALSGPSARDTEALPKPSTENTEPSAGDTEALPKPTEIPTAAVNPQPPKHTLPSRGLPVYAPRVQHNTALRGYQVTTTPQGRAEYLINQSELFLQKLEIILPEVSRIPFIEALSLRIPTRKAAETTCLGGSLMDLITAQKAQAAVEVLEPNDDDNDEETLCDSESDDDEDGAINQDPDFDWEYFVTLETQIPEAHKPDNSMYTDTLPAQHFGRYHSLSEASGQVFARAHETFFSEYRTCYGCAPRKEDVTIVCRIQPDGFHTCSFAYGNVLVAGHVARKPGRKKRLPAGAGRGSGRGAPCWHVYVYREYSNTTKKSERPGQAPTLVVACTSRESANRAAGGQWVREVEDEEVWEYVAGLDNEVEECFMKEYRPSEEEGMQVDCSGQETWGEKAEDLRLEMVKVWVQRVEVLGPGN